MRTKLSTSPLPQPHPVLQLCRRSTSSHGRPGSTSRAGGQDVCDYQAFSVYHGSPREETVLPGMGDWGMTVIGRWSLIGDDEIIDKAPSYVSSYSHTFVNKPQIGMPVRNIIWWSHTSAARQRSGRKCVSGASCNLCCKRKGLVVTLQPLSCFHKRMLPWSNSCIDGFHTTWLRSRRGKVGVCNLQAKYIALHWFLTYHQYWRSCFFQSGTAAV